MKGGFLMVYNKQEFIRTYLNDKVEEISFAQIDLDISDMSVSDILRNINKTYPQNTRCRNQISSGQLAVAVLCKSEFMYPLKGLLIIVVNSDKPIELISKDYIVMTISDADIKSDESIVSIIKGLTSYLVENFKDIFESFEDFFVKYVYDPQEDSEWEEEYYSE